MTTEDYRADPQKPSGPRDQVDSGVAYILYLENHQARFLKSTNLNASLRHFTVYNDAGSLTAEYGATLFPRAEPYIMDLPGRPYNIDYRDASGVYFIRPTSGKMIVHSEEAGPADTYINRIIYVNVKFEHEGREVVINGTGEATFVFK
ncbi:hypothetical protein ACW9H6_18720 [Pseudomonas sp. SDO528_S397]